MKLLDNLGDNGWSGGQYSLLRFTFGVMLGSYFIRLFALLFFDQLPIPAVEAGLTLNLYSFLSSPSAYLLLTAAGFVFSVLLAIGWYDRRCGIFAAYLLICSSRRFALQGVSVLDFSAWLLLLHFLTPPAPYGSVAALGRPDPDGGWRLPRSVHSTAWIFLSLLYFGIGLVTILQLGIAQQSHPSAAARYLLMAAAAGDLLFPASIVWRRLQIPFWLLLLILTPVQMLLMGQIGGMFSLVLFHLFVFDPRWVRPLPKSSAGGSELLFFDGECGLCHYFVRFVIAEDRSGRFSFSPLQSERYQQELISQNISAAPDSIGVLSADGRLLYRSAGVIYVLDRLGGIWRIGGTALGLLPRAVLDWIYDRIAAVRKKFFEQPKQACPLVGPEIARRFI